MVSIKAIREANKTTASKSPTAVFVGATSGIGLGAIEALLKNTSSPRILIIGRSETKFSSTFERLQGLNQSAQLTFIEAQVSLLKEVSRVCTEFSSQESSLDILWLSQGGMSLSGHEFTSEGLNTTFATNYYSRILFMHKLLPLLRNSSDARIISVLSIGEEGPIITSDFGISDPQNNSFFPAMRQNVSMMSLCMREMSLANTKISFVHTFPGLVSSPVHEKWAATMSGSLTPLRWLVNWVFIPIRNLVAWTTEEAGQTGFYEAINGRFAAGAKGNFFRLTDKAEEANMSVVLGKQFEEGLGPTIWDHTLEVFERLGC